MKQAVILAAGEGRRLRPFTVNKPKAMIHIAGKPIIRYVIESLAYAGIREIIVVVGYKREQIFDYLGDGKRFGVDISYIIQSEQLGTAHALSKAKVSTGEEFLVLPGDKLITENTIAGLLKNRPLSVLVKREENPSRFGVVEVEGGLITDIMASSPEPKSALVNTGIYLFDKDIFDFIESKLDIPDAIREMLRNGINIYAIETDQSWLDVVYPWDILTLNTAILQNISSSRSGTIESSVFLNGRVFIGQGTIIRANSYITGPVVIGDDCEIGPNICILPASSIGNHVIVSPFTVIKNSIISDDVRIGSGSNIESSIIDRNCTIGGHFSAFSEITEMQIERQIYSVKIGAMIGERCEIGSGVVAQPGLVAGNYCQVKSLKSISGTLADRSMVV